MENTNEKKYYFIWLYISLLLHLLMVIIMLTIKPGSSKLSEPDPAFQQIDRANIIFVTDEPTQPTPDDNDEVQAYKMAKRTQGSAQGTTERGLTDPTSATVQQDDAQDDTDDSEKETVLDISSKALTDEYKKGLKDETTVKEQTLIDNSVQEKISAMIAPKESDVVTQSQQPSDIIAKIDDKKIETEKLAELHDTQQKSIEIIKQFNQLAQDRPAQPKKQPELSAIAPSKNLSVEPIPKIESKKHRPIDIGSENRSKLELIKNISENIAPKKKKLSLQDLNLQQGFSDFIQKGNAAFSVDGNADEDDEIGLKRSSYVTQVKKMHDNACRSYPQKYTIKHKDQIPPLDSIVNMTIDRSGKVTLTQSQSSGNQAYDDYHMNILIFMGECPRIPKFIEAPLTIKSVFYTATGLASFGSYQPEKLQI